MRQASRRSGGVLDRVIGILPSEHGWQVTASELAPRAYELTDVGEAELVNAVASGSTLILRALGPKDADHRGPAYAVARARALSR